MAMDKEKLLNGKSKGIASILPGSWKACYLGAYAQYGTFSVKPGETGRQGTLFGAGVSAGWETPLYQYSRGVIDLDLGLSIGVIASQWTNYQLNQDNYTYSRVGGEPDRLHVLPMVTELRAVFSWRRRSVRESVRRNATIAVWRSHLSSVSSTLSRPGRLASSSS